MHKSTVESRDFCVDLFCQALGSCHQVQQLQGFGGWSCTKVCDKVVGLNLTRSQALDVEKAHLTILKLN